MSRPELPAVPCLPYNDIRPNIRSGDILMCSGSAVFSRLIQSATRSPWSHVGYPYDRDEIIKIAARVAGSTFGMEYEKGRQNKAFICSEYVQKCYEQIGIVIPYDSRGFIAPADFAACSNIKVLWEIEAG